MKYEEVVSYINIRYPELNIINHTAGSVVGEGITVDWGMQEEQATYCNLERENGKREYYAFIGEFKKSGESTLALLHEVGHHISDQSGSVLEKEMNAWTACFALMGTLEMVLTVALKNTAKVWFSSYVKAYGSSEEVRTWITTVGFNEGVKSKRCTVVKPLFGFESWKFRY